MKNIVPIFYLISFILLNKIAYGQDNNEIENIFKHSVCKEVVLFLNKDTMVFKNPVNYQYTGRNISDLKLHYKSLDGVSRVIDDILKIPINFSNKETFSSSTDLFIESALTSITKDKRSIRKSYPAYSNLVLELKNTKEEYKQKLYPKETKNDETTVDNSVETTSLPKNESQLSAGLTFALFGFMSLVLSIIFFIFNRQNKKIKEEISLLRNIVSGSNSFNSEEFKDQIILLVQDSLKKFKEELRIANKPNDTQKTLIKDEISNEIKKESIIQKSDFPKEYFIRYAEYGNAFNPDSLSESPSDKSIFEIIMKNEKEAEFAVSSNKSAQEYALTNFEYYLKDTCNYSSLPKLGANIRTDKNGKIELINNRWEVKTKANISFK